jgi:hypothetical protein
MIQRRARQTCLAVVGLAPQDQFARSRRSSESGGHILTSRRSFRDTIRALPEGQDAGLQFGASPPQGFTGHPDRGYEDGMFDCVQSVYDPGHFNDRLLLGLKGTMSEALRRCRHCDARSRT